VRACDTNLPNAGNECTNLCSQGNNEVIWLFSILVFHIFPICHFLFKPQFSVGQFYRTLPNRYQSQTRLFWIYIPHTCIWKIVSNCISTRKTLRQSIANFLYSSAKDARSLAGTLLVRRWRFLPLSSTWFGELNVVSPSLYNALQLWTILSYHKLKPKW
jgi:hypothetical protein